MTQAGHISSLNGILSGNLSCRCLPRNTAYAAVIALLIVVSGCAVPETLQLDEGTFITSEVEKEIFFERYAEKNQTLNAISGRASVQVSEPGRTERANIRFRSDRLHSLLLISNNLGIEGGRIYSDPDSVIVYNRIEEVAHKMSHEEAAWFYLNGIGAMNLIRMLHPITAPEQIDAIYESDDFFLIRTNHGDRHFVSREQMSLRRTERPTHHPQAYSTFSFDNYAEIEGHRLPRRIQILSTDETSNIFLVIRALEVNPTELEFDPGIPGDVALIRL